MTLSESNFLIYAMHNYSNPQCHCVEEFSQDMKRFSYIGKLIKRYVLGGGLKERLILNHIIVLYNVFDKSATDMLLYRVGDDCRDVLITFLHYLNYIPESEIDVSKLDNVILDTLRRI